LSFVALFAFYSCDEDILDITEEFYYSSEITVLSNDTVTTVNETVDMTSESDIINDYKDKIETVEITEVKYWLTQHEGDSLQEIIEATLMVADADGANETLIATIENKVLSTLMGEDNAQELDIQQAGVNQMASLIKNEPYTFQIKYHTACNEAPLNFTVKFQFKVKMVANPL
jgi:hypothetical protein